MEPHFLISNETGFYIGLIGFVCCLLFGPFWIWLNSLSIWDKKEPSYEDRLRTAAQSHADKWVAAELRQQRAEEDIDRAIR